MAAKARKKNRRKTKAARAAAGKTIRASRMHGKKKRSVARTVPAKRAKPKATPAKTVRTKPARPAPSPRATSSPKSEWTPPISSEAVAARTGRTWDQWLELIDAAGGMTLGHPAIASMLYREHGVDGWWAQMVTVGYEQARGLRALHQRPDGYEISRTRVISAPIAVVYAAFVEDEARSRWMEGTRIVVHKATPHKYARATWTDGSKSIAVGFYPKGDAKTQISIQHGRLMDAAEAEKMKTFWGQRLDVFQAMIEGAAAEAPAAQETT